MIKQFIVVFIFSLFPCLTFSQITSFTDDFEDASLDTIWNQDVHTLWNSSFPNTYTLVEQNGILTVNYVKNSSTGDDDHFRFTPPEGIDISNNPRASLKIKSSVNTTFTFYLAFFPQFGFAESFTVNIPGDNEWHTYGFEIDPNSFGSQNLQYINLSFGQGISSNQFGEIELDDLKIAGFVIEILNFEAEVIDGNKVQLQWISSDPDATNIYKIYRSTEPGFTPSNNNFITGTTNTSFLNQGLQPFQKYYYKVVPADTLGEEFFPSEEVRAETYEIGISPEITIIETNKTTVGKYEKFALSLELSNVGISNPYDPDDIDVYSWFKSPAGDTTWINGFYDNYQNVDLWRIYFSPNQTGTWEYQVFASDVGGTGESAVGSFEAIESEHKGWIKASETNPHYFVHDDGSSYFPVGSYSPWGNNENRFQTFANHDANFFAIWNINYGGFVNQGNLTVIENELGRYNQPKLGRLDSLVSRLEKEDIKIMYAIWPHDLISATVWATAWDLNPYNQFTTAVDFYGDSLAWEYQKKKYRYLIARYAHSRSWGIWELVNEMNGTDGWMQGRTAEAYSWVEKAQQYFTENDPYGHPMTASFSGGFTEYRPELYNLIDVPNIHMYPAQGWPQEYSNDLMRSSMYNYAWASRRFFNSYDKPSIFGESGAELAYFNSQTPEYTESYHNAIWAAIANGLAGAPVWWENAEMDRDGGIRWDYLQYLAWFTEDLDVGNLPYTLASISADQSDAYAMVEPSSSFGWVRTYNGNNIAETSIYLDGLNEGSYSVEWYNTWIGETVATDTLVSLFDNLEMVAPDQDQARKDIAFKIRTIENGTVPSALNLKFKETDLVLYPDSGYTLAAYITDESGRLIGNANNEISFTLSGNGSLSSTTVMAENGIALVTYFPDNSDFSTVSITAEASGLTSASLNDVMVTESEEESELAVPSRFILEQNYPNPFNPATTISYSLPENGFVTLDVFDITGRKVVSLVNQVQSAGRHEITFDASGLSSGIYLYRLQSGSFTQTNRMVLLK